MLLLVALALLHSAPDVPVRAQLWLPAAAGELPSSLLEARRLADQLRYEEAVVEYQRYLGVPERPIAERAAALFELGFLHLVLGDEVSARQRAQQAFDLSPELQLPPGAPARQLDFLAQMRKEQRTRAKLAVLPRASGDLPQVVRAELSDPSGRVKAVLVRHAEQRAGPYQASALRCEEGRCVGSIPPPPDASDYTQWFYLEALDAQRLTLAQAASADAPLQLSVVGRRPWYHSPWVWGVGGAAAVGIAAVVFFLAPRPPQ